MIRPPRQLEFLSALLPQLMLAALAPTLVICQEGTGARVIEFSVSDCCSDAATESNGEAGQALRTSDEACGGCQDVFLAVSLQRDDVQTPVVVVPTPLLVRELPPGPLLGLELARAPPQEFNGPDPGLRALRTVRLRC